MNSLIDEIRRPLPDEPDWWIAVRQYPKRLFDQHFGYELLEEDLDLSYPGFDHLICPRKKEFIQAKTGYSEVEITETEFKISLLIEQFGPEELDVQVVKGFVVVSGAHAEEEDETGTICRGFSRRYMLPHDYSGRDITSVYSRDRKLLIITVTKTDVVDKAIEIEVK